MRLDRYFFLPVARTAACGGRNKEQRAVVQQRCNKLAKAKASFRLLALFRLQPPLADDPSHCRPHRRHLRDRQDPPVLVHASDGREDRQIASPLTNPRSFIAPHRHRSSSARRRHHHQYARVPLTSLVPF
ncbi:hypothetical protein GUJ93_ZPchr0002g24912 [Zizania palustris]|uniref:Uncharacterized protein n=1 Tax=Zizania palustris TaxID=103762 RepID=A0A8J5VWW9_ZIZPA|nr:hypothetical protein GUJ93_ZPchr0002g24912 [Zizania palustris]